LEIVSVPPPVTALPGVTRSFSPLGYIIIRSRPFRVKNVLCHKKRKTGVSAEEPGLSSVVCRMIWAEAASRSESMAHRALWDEDRGA